MRCRLSPASCALRCLSRSVRRPCWLLSWSARPLSWQKHGRRQPRRRPRRLPPARASAFWRSRGRRRCGGRRTEGAAQRRSPAQCCAVGLVRPFVCPMQRPRRLQRDCKFVCLRAPQAQLVRSFVVCSSISKNTSPSFPVQFGRVDQLNPTFHVLLFCAARFPRPTSGGSGVRCVYQSCHR